MTSPQYQIPTIQTLLQKALNRLTPHTASPSLDARVLLAYITGKPRTWLLAHPEVCLSSIELQHLEQSLEKLESGLPLPYLLGEWEFFSLRFKVTLDALIPRPETELLVETALGWLETRFSPQRRKEREEDLNKPSLRPSRDLRALRVENPQPKILAADIGTGTGCIAVTLAARCPQLHVVATDLSPAALALARHNAQMHRVADRITFLEADLLTFDFPPSTLRPHPSPFDLITANLPYIPTSTLHTLQVYEREPTLALDGGPDGLTLIRRLLSQAAPRLAPGGLILLEIEATQGEEAQNLARKHFPGAGIEIRPDLSGHDRLLLIQTSSRE